MTGQAKMAVRLIDVAGTFQAREELGQSAAAPMTQLQPSGYFANALRARRGGKIGQQDSFVNFLGTRRRTVLIGVAVFFLHEGRFSLYGAAVESLATFFRPPGLIRR